MTILLAVLSISLIFLLLIRKEYQGSKLFVAIRNFSVAVCLLSLLYFFFYYREVVQNEFALALPWRILDYLLYGCLYLSWLALMDRLTMSAEERRPWIIWVSGGFALALTLVDVAVTIFFMGPYYNIDNTAIYGIWVAWERLCSTGLAVTLIVACAVCLRCGVEARRRRYLWICTLILSGAALLQALLDARLAAGRYGVSAWKMEVFDITIPTMLILSVVTLVFVFQEDFRPLYFREEIKQLEMEASEAERFTQVAELFSLTARERDVLRLLSLDYSNPDIAEELFITRNTVKKHIQNLYEKMGVNSRKEAIALLNMQKH